ncbi:hypothetical protein ACQBAU_00585 [Propionibacteriaceae bacterium Y2011]
MAKAISARTYDAVSPKTYVPAAETDSDTVRFAELLDELATAPDERPALIGPHNEQIPHTTDFPHAALTSHSMSYDAAGRI